MKNTHIYTQQDAILDFANRFQRQYFYKVWRRTVSSDSINMEQIHTTSLGFTKETTIEEARDVLGSFSHWLDIMCDNCDSVTTDVVRVGENQEWDTHAIQLCEECTNDIQEAFLNNQESKAASINQEASDAKTIKFLELEIERLRSIPSAEYDPPIVYMKMFELGGKRYGVSVRKHQDYDYIINFIEESIDNFKKKE